MPAEVSVSVIIPCYNYGIFLPDTLTSLLNQSFTNWECILVNNGSSDSTKKVCLEYCAKDSRFKYLECANEGPAAARNEGFKSANGKYIQYLDADDLLESEKLNVQVQFLESNPACDLVYSQASTFKSLASGKPSVEGLEPAMWIKKIDLEGIELFNLLIRGNIMPIQSPLMRRALFNKAGIMDPQLRGYEDWDLFLRFSLNDTRFTYLEKEGCTSYIRMHESSLSRKAFHMDDYRVIVFEKMLLSSKTGLLIKPYLFIRYLQQRSHQLIRRLAGNKPAIIHQRNNSMLVNLFLDILLVLYFPVYLIIELLRRILSSLS